MSSSRLVAPQLEPSAPGAYAALGPGPQLRWTNRQTLWRARRDWVARVRGDPSHRIRARRFGHLSDAERVVDRTHLIGASFAVLGDPGDGDASQFAVVPPLLATCGDCELLLIASDVVYPAGGIAEYEAKFHRPYAAWPGEILAVPGNHDWYDGLDGFTHHLIDRGAVPSPYWVLDLPALRVIGIDTGILGALDAEQGAWLRRVAVGRDVAKVLVSGAPMVVDGARRPCPILGGGTVDAVVDDPAARFVAVLAGDVHNYQRHPVHLADGRVVHHVTCGGGGAYTNGTHTIPPVDLPGVEEDEVRLYPLRGDSLSWFSVRFDAWARRSSRTIPPSTLPPDVASALVAERLGLVPTRASAREAQAPTAQQRAAMHRVWPASGMRGLNRFYAEYYDTDDPPFLCSFLRADLTGEELRLRCFAATGRAADEADPPIQDDCIIGLG